MIAAAKAGVIRTGSTYTHLFRRVNDVVKLAADPVVRFRIVAP